MDAAHACGYVDEDDITVARFRSLLDQLTKKCAMREEELGDLSVYMWKELRKKGVEEKLLNMMEGANQAILVNGNDGLCKAFYALYATARETGNA